MVQRPGSVLHAAVEYASSQTGGPARGFTMLPSVIGASSCGKYIVAGGQVRCPYTLLEWYPLYYLLDNDGQPYKISLLFEKAILSIHSPASLAMVVLHIYLMMSLLGEQHG